MTDDKLELCAYCDFLLPPPTETAKQGLCMRYPPVVAAGNEQRRPRVDLTEWCGEFKTRDD